MIGENGITLVKEFEGCKLKAYRCPANVITVGYGATGDGITMETEWTQEQADTDLTRRLSLIALWIDGVVTRKTTQRQKDAFASLIYNIGQKAFKSSTVLREFNAGNIQSAANAFLLWDKATVNGRKQVLSGLSRRREAEKALFLKG